MKAFKLFSPSPPSEVIRGKKVAGAGLTLHAPAICNLESALVAPERSEGGIPPPNLLGSPQNQPQILTT